MALNPTLVLRNPSLFFQKNLNVLQAPEIVCGVLFIGFGFTTSYSKLSILHSIPLHSTAVFHNKFTLCHIKPNIYIKKTKFASHK